MLTRLYFLEMLVLLLKICYVSIFMQAPQLVLVFSTGGGKPYYFS